MTAEYAAGDESDGQQTATATPFGLVGCLPRTGSSTTVEGMVGNESCDSYPARVGLPSDRARPAPVAMAPPSGRLPLIARLVPIVMPAWPPGKRIQIPLHKEAYFVVTARIAEKTTAGH